MPRKPHPSAVKAVMPSHLEPMLPTLVQRPFSDREWIYEPKWDGWRALCFIKDGHAHFLSRKHKSLSERFPELRRIGQSVKAGTAVLDGEVTALDSNGLPHFNGLNGKSRCAIVYYAFDLLYLDGYDLTGCPLLVRKASLRGILPRSNTGRIRYTDHIVGKGEKMFSSVEQLSLEGIVCKRKDSVYSFGRSRNWVKVKTRAGKAEMQLRIENWRP